MDESAAGSSFILFGDRSYKFSETLARIQKLQDGWKEGGNLSVQRKPKQHRENMYAPHTDRGQDLDPQPWRCDTHSATPQYSIKHYIFQILRTIKPSFQLVNYGHASVAC